MSTESAARANVVSEEIAQLLRHLRLVVFDFDGVFTDNRVLVLQDGTEGVFCNRGDGFGIEALTHQGIGSLVLSTERNPVVTARCKKLNLPCIQAVDDKVEVLKKELARSGIALAQVAYLGNDINDLGCLRLVGLPASVADAHPSIFSAVKFVTQKNGGEGAVREFCEVILRAKIGEKGPWGDLGKRE